MRDRETNAVDDEDEEFQVLLEYHEGNFDWASHTLQKLRTLNHSACAWLMKNGYNGNALKAMANLCQRL